MRHNPDLVREIMLAVEQHPAGKKLYGSQLKTSCHNPYELADHVQHLIDEGLIEGEVHLFAGHFPPKFSISRITTVGHDFLAAMREDQFQNN